MGAAPEHQTPSGAPGTATFREPHAAEIGRLMDQAIALFRIAMPGRGLKLLVPPPLADGSATRLSLSAWRRDGASARVHSGASAGEVMTRVIDWERAADREARRRRDCPHCGGVGWYVAARGIRVLCTH